MNQEIAISFVKKKGTGATMGKNLSSEELSQCNELFQSKTVHLTTKATLLTAFVMLENTKEEARWLANAKLDSSTIIPQELHPLLEATPTNDPFYTQCLKLVNYTNATHNDIISGLDHVFNPETPEWQSAIFLEALRLKRETPTENKAALDYYTTHSYQWDCNLDHLLYLSNPFDGMKRHMPFSIFVAPLLASIGIPTVLHGVQRIGPKYGLTAHDILAEAGHHPLKSGETIKTQLENPNIGWGYIDQSISFPEAFKLKTLRQNMIKRPFLATIEKLNPVFKAKENTIVTGYTHPPYKEKSISLCHHNTLYDHSIIIRGVEGSSECHPNKRTRLLFGSDPNAMTETFIEANDSIIYPEFDSLSKTLEYGLKCLNGAIPHHQNPCIHMATQLINCSSFKNKERLLEKIIVSINNSKALDHWNLAGKIN